jgi:hypothetical protein
MPIECSYRHITGSAVTAEAVQTIILARKPTYQPPSGVAQLLAVQRTVRGRLLGLRSHLASLLSNRALEEDHLVGARRLHAVRVALGRHHRQPLPYSELPECKKQKAAMTAAKLRVSICCAT